jgi:predicted GTPase
MQLNAHDAFDNDVLNYEIYQKALSKCEENDNSIRVNVVGNFAQGKTSLTNILVGKDSESVQSTNGVEISRCEYSNAQEGVKFFPEIIIIGRQHIPQTYYVISTDCEK